MVATGKTERQQSEVVTDVSISIGQRRLLALFYKKDLVDIVQSAYKFSVVGRGAHSTTFSASKSRRPQVRTLPVRRERRAMRATLMIGTALPVLAGTAKAAPLTGYAGILDASTGAGIGCISDTPGAGGLSVTTMDPSKRPEVAFSDVAMSGAHDCVDGRNSHLTA